MTNDNKGAMSGSRRHRAGHRGARDRVGHPQAPHTDLLFSERGASTGRDQRASANAHAQTYGTIPAENHKGQPTRPGWAGWSLYT